MTIAAPLVGAFVAVIFGALVMPWKEEETRSLWFTFRRVVAIAAFLLAVVLVASLVYSLLPAPVPMTPIR